MPHLGVFFLQLPVCVRQIDHDGFYKADIEFLMHHGCHAADFRRQQQIKVVTAAKKLHKMRTMCRRSVSPYAFYLNRACAFILLKYLSLPK